ncbi:MAG: chemotaxis protein CheD [Planctomycetes bacterium]|nr:chemotaxis protein CheD [Planctomycetota bacterium]
MIWKLLAPGQYHISKEPTLIETLVGSCVSVCLYNIRNGWAGMNHFLMDYPKTEADCDIGKYGSTATEYIINNLMKGDPVAGHFRAQVFGGAGVIKGVRVPEEIGRKNVEVALELLKATRIRIINQEIGGTRGRRIKFNTATGEVQWRFAGNIPRKAKLSLS